jgi:N-acetylglucosamine kinase-like BadF-type ATPase
MTVILGVDGGQSAIRTRCSNAEAIAETEGTSRLEGDSTIAVADAVENGWRQLGKPAIDRVVLGLTTAPIDPSELDRLAALVGARINVSDVWVCDDTVTAHAGALSTEWGVSLSAGTGVACLALGTTGSPIAFDGHGYLLGDDGAGFWIGREGLRAALRQSEGRGALTALTAAAIDRFGEIAGLPARIHESARAVNDIAQFAPLVLEAASDDRVAADIVGRAALALAETVSGAVGAIAAGDTPVPVALGGRLLAQGSALAKPVRSAIADRAPLAVVRNADASPLEGALQLGSMGRPTRYDEAIHFWEGNLTR